MLTKKKKNTWQHRNTWDKAENVGSHPSKAEWADWGGAGMHSLWIPQHYQYFYFKYEKIPYCQADIQHSCTTKSDVTFL